MKRVWHWDVRSWLFQATKDVAVDPYSLLIVSRHCARVPLKELIRHSKQIVCADGGANALFDETDGACVPLAIYGDMDSIRPEVLAYYEKRGATTMRKSTQSESDLDYVLDCLDRTPNVSTDTVLIAGGLGGNFTQSIGNLSTVFRVSSTLPRYHSSKMVLVGGGNAACLLPAGEHHMNMSDLTHLKVGLLPLFGPCRVHSTSGLKWNLESKRLAMGGLISTSNRADRERCVVDVLDPILLTLDWDF